MSGFVSSILHDYALLQSRLQGCRASPSRARRKGIKVHSVIHANEAYLATFGLPPLPPTTPLCLLLQISATRDCGFGQSLHQLWEVLNSPCEAWCKYHQDEEKSYLRIAFLTACIYDRARARRYREQTVVFNKGDARHKARIVTYVDIKKGRQPKLVSLLTNDFDMALQTIVKYTKRWLIESLFKQIKQNFPLRYFYGESTQRHQDTGLGDTRSQPAYDTPAKTTYALGASPGLATMVRIVLMYYINMDTFFERPDEDLKLLLKQTAEEPPEEENLK